MTLRTILHYPDNRLRQLCPDQTQYNNELETLISDMFETMYDAKGIGLAGTQVDFHKRLLVTDVSIDKDEPHVLINPVILSTDGIVDSNEGCLSVPGFQDDVQRAKNIIVKYLDRDGASKETEMSGLLAICVQHEIDHLNGKLFIDYLSEAKKQKVRKLIRKQEKD